MRMSKPQYDSIGGAYDLVAGLDLYHRICWGVSTAAYRDFASQAEQASAPGRLLDAGCGSRLFSAHLNPVIGLDASREMLNRARQRASFAFVQADLLHTPFGDGVFEAVLCLHVAHVMENLDGLLRELRRVLKPGGRLFLTSVVIVGHWRDRYLRMLSRRGIMASPRSANDVIAPIRGVFEVEPQHHRVGSMLFTVTPA